MAHVLIKYSVPLTTGEATLDGAVDTVIRGWQNFAVSLAINVPITEINAYLYVPSGYYPTGEPSVNLNPPKVGLCDVSITSTNYSATPLSPSLTRHSGSLPGIT